MRNASFPCLLAVLLLLLTTCALAQEGTVYGMLHGKVLFEALPWRRSA